MGMYATFQVGFSEMLWTNSGTFSVSFFLWASSFQSVFSFSVEMSSGSPSGFEGADPLLVTDKEVSIS